MEGAGIVMKVKLRPPSYPDYVAANMRKSIFPIFVKANWYATATSDKEINLTLLLAAYTQAFAKNHHPRELDVSGLLNGCLPAPRPPPD